MKLLFRNASQVVTCAGPGRGRRGAEMQDASVRTETAVLVEGERIAAVGRESDLATQHRDAEVVDCQRGVLLPGLVDSHTHLVFGKSRHEEHELRASGLDYMEIARRGGGIHSSVRDLRGRTEDELFDLARSRLRHLASFGTTTLEIKSGYGLTLADELKSLRVIRRLREETPLRLIPTFLGAHEIPQEYRRPPDGTPRTEPGGTTFRGERSDYVALLVQEMIPEVVAGRLARFADVFCEPGVFTIDETRTILTAAKAAGLGLKLHADELRGAGGAELAVELGATSADHLAAISDDGIRALGGSNTVATLLPATMLFLGKEKQAPARALLDAGAIVAIATDFNPGTSPTANLPLVMTLAVSQLRMRVAETVLASTVNGAAALGLAAEVGQIAPGFGADLALFEVGDVRELPYWFGARRCRATWVRGRAAYH